VFEMVLVQPSRRNQSAFRAGQGERFHLDFRSTARLCPVDLVMAAGRKELKDRLSDRTPAFLWLERTPTVIHFKLLPVPQGQRPRASDYERATLALEGSAGASLLKTTRQAAEIR